jgi:MoaA/NifB/PqqE/SkfB family radical SAM enzyme
MITTECSNNCNYCFVKSQKNYKIIKNDINKIKEKLDLLQSNLYEIVGGEPFENLDFLKWFFEYNKNNKNVGLFIFTSGLFNIDKFIELAKSYKKVINIAVSYDGRYSKRNKDNYQIVLNNIKKLKQYFPTTMRWSINIEDIPFIYDTFLELKSLDIEMPLFFPMKYKDYTKKNIEIFKLNFTKIIDYCIKEQFNFLKLYEPTSDRCFANKINFSCDDEMTILPDGKLTNCYVLYTSKNFDETEVYDDYDLYLKRKPDLYNKKERCNTCISVFNCCNKCLGNLREYQLKTGNDFFNSYCDLINELSIIYIKKVIKNIDSCAKFTFIQGDQGIMKVENINGHITIFKANGEL